MTIDRRDYYSEAQVKKLCDYWQKRAAEDMKYGKANAVRTWMVVDLALNTGLRRAELCMLCIEHINFEEKWILAHRKKKTKKTNDPIPLSDKLAGHIKEYMEYFKITVGPLLRGSRGPYSLDGLYAVWCTAVKKAKLRHLPLHGSRHTVAVQLLRKTHNLRLVQKQLGHTSPEMTATYYADVPFEDRQEAANGLWD